MPAMDRLDGQHDVAQRIRAVSDRVVLLTGPAACGKTAACLDLLGQLGPAGLLLAPSAAAATYLRRRLLAESPAGALAGANVLTFAKLVSRILARAGEAAAAGHVLSDLQRTLLLRRIIDELAADSRLEALQSVLDTRGLPASIDAAIAELKRAAIEPEDVARIASRDDVTRALHAVYERYQTALHAANAYDLEGRCWLARDVLRRAAEAGEPLPGLGDITMIAVDGFTDFTPTQLETLALIGRNVERMVICLPHDAGGAERLWQWTDRTGQRVREAFGEGLAIVSVDRPPRQGVGVLWDGLFDHNTRPVDAPEDLQAIVAAGMDQEVAAVAVEIKRLLTGSAPPGRIAIIARSLSEYGPSINRIFGRCDIPIADTPRPVTDVPAIRFLLAAASLGSDVPSQVARSVLSNSYFRPQALGEFDGRTVMAARALIDEANVLGGRAAYQRAAERMSRRAEQAAPADADDGDGAPAADALLRSADDVARAGRLIDALFDLPTDDLVALIDALQLRRAICEQDDPRRIARDLRAVAALVSAVGGIDASPRALREALVAVRCPAAGGESAVDVLDCLDSRACRYDHVFLLGLSEGTFPRRFVDTPLLSERTRRALRDTGHPIDLRDDLSAREMLLFYLSVSRADRTLTVTTLESDAAGKPTAPGPFLTALLRPVGGLEALNHQRIGLDQLVPPANRLIAAADVAARAWMDVFTSVKRVDSPSLRWVGRDRPHAIDRAAAGLWAASRRWRAGACDSFDGRITHDDLLAELAERYPDGTVFSASQLERYAHCPWRFFATYVLNLDEPISRQRHLEAADRGRLCHDILFELFTRLAEAHGSPVRLGQLDADTVRAELAAAAQRVARRQRLQPAYPRLWQLQFDRLCRQIDRTVQAERADTTWPAAGQQFELAFGLAGSRAADDPHDRASRDEPVTIETPAGPIRLRGRIDRIDRIESDLGDGLVVVDYKTGRLPAPKDIAEGRAIQIPLYALAAEALLGETALGGLYQRIADEPARRFCSAVHVDRRALKANDAYPDTLAATLAAVGRTVRAMAAGRFDALPTHDCPRGCAFREICHYAPQRALLKTAEPEDTL